METLPIIVSLTDEEAERLTNDAQKAGTKGLFRRDGDTAKAFVSTEKLKVELAAVSAAVLKVLDDIKQVGQFKLKEVTLGVEVTAEGGIVLVGTAKVGGKGAITLKFTE